MRLTLRVLGLTVVDLEITDTDDNDVDLTEPPQSFGFHGSGTGIIELDDKEDRTLDNIDTYDRSNR